MRLLFPFFLVVFLFPNRCHASDPPDLCNSLSDFHGNFSTQLPASAPDTQAHFSYVSYFNSSWADVKGVMTAPVRWKSSDWILFSSAIAASVIISTQDQAIYRFFERNRSARTDNLSGYGLEPWGSGVYSLPLLGSMFIYGSAGNNTKAKVTALAGFKSYLVAGVLANMTKNIIRRHRPYQSADHTDGSQSHYLFGGPLGQRGYASFPSGHTTAAFAVASSVSYIYRDKPWVPVLAYGLAGLAGLSRVHDQKHWGSDIIMGAFFGWAIGRFMAKSDEARFIPVSTVSGPGIGIQIGKIRH